MGVSCNGWRWLPPNFVGTARSGRAFAPTWIRWIVCVYAQHPWYGMCQGSTTVPSSETFSPFFNADIRTPLFSADVLKKCALIALHVIAEEGRDGDGCHDVMSRVWGTKWKFAAQRGQCGRVETKLGRKTKVCLLVALVKATCATMRCTSSGCTDLVARSPFSCRIGSWQRWH